MAHARQGLRRHPVQRPDTHHRGKRQGAARGVELLHRRPRRARGTAPGRATNDVCRHPLPERPLRVRSRAGGLPPQVEVPTQRRRGGDRHRVLRRRKSRRRLRERPHCLQPARRPYGGDRGRHGSGDLEHQGRRRAAGRVDSHGAPRRGRPGHRGDRRRRIRGARVGEGARPRDGPRRLDGLQCRTRRRDPGATRDLPAVLRQGRRSGPDHLAPRWVEARRRARVGLALVRSGARPVLLRHRQSGTVQRRAASRGQQMGDERPGAPPGRREPGLGVSVHTGRQLGLRRRAGDDPGGPDRPGPPPPRAGALRQERLRLHDRSRNRRGAGGGAVRGRELGQAGRSHNRAPRGRFHEAHGRFPREREGHLPDARRWQEPAARRVFPPHRAVLRSHEQHVHGLSDHARHVPRRDAVHRS